MNGYRMQLQNMNTLSALLTLSMLIEKNALYIKISDFSLKRIIFNLNYHNNGTHIVMVPLTLSKKHKKIKTH